MCRTPATTPGAAGPAAALRRGRPRLPALAGALLVAAALAAAALLAGCSAAAPPAPRATPAGCYAFAVHALHRRLTVTAIPPACAGLSHAQVNEIVDRAIRASVGPLPKAAARARANGESRYLAGLIRAVAPPPAASTQPGPASPPVSTEPADLAALAVWTATAAAGAYLLAGRLGRLGRPGGRKHQNEAPRERWNAGSTPPLVIAAHAWLGAAGLAVWIAFVVTAVTALAWAAVGLTFVLAGLGMATLLTASSDAPPAEPAPAGAAPAGAPAAAPAGAPAATAPAGVPAAAAPAGMAVAGRRPPVLVIALHGALATATVLLVLLAAIGAG